MVVNLSPIWGAGAQLLDNSGNVLTGGKIYTYLAGTTTPATTYTSSSGITANSNPIILNSAGRVPYEIWLTDSIEYKFVLKDSNDTLIGTWDNLVGINSNFINYYGQQEIQTATAGQTVFTLADFEYQPGTGNLSVFVDGVNQYGPGAQYAFIETNSTTVTFVSGLHVGASVKFTTTKLENPGVADASQISYTAPYSGAVTENVQERLAQYVSVKDFGAVGDGVTDDTAAVQAAVEACPVGGVLYINGLFGIKGTGTEIILIDKPMTIQGQGLASSGFHVLTGTSASTDVIRVTPDMALSDGEGYFFYDFQITSDSTSIGRNALNLDITNTGQKLKNVQIQRCRFEGLSNRGIVTTNPIPNIESVFTTTIRDCVVVNGIYFENAGDSLRVEDCTLTGNNYGVYFKLIPGANKPIVSGCNITSKSGAVYVDGPTDCAILYNNIEALSVNDGTDQAFIYLTGTALNPPRNTIINGNIFGMLADGGTPRVLRAISTNYNDHTIISNNRFNRALPLLQQSFSLSSNSRYAVVYANNDLNADNVANLGYNDAGVGTIGTVRDFPAAASGYQYYTSSGNWDTPKYTKDVNNMVTLSGYVALNGGAWTDGQTFATLPVNYRPYKTEIFSVMALETGIGHIVLPLYITTNGELQLQGVTGRTFTWVGFNGVVFTAL